MRRKHSRRSIDSKRFFVARDLTDERAFRHDVFAART